MKNIIVLTMVILFLFSTTHNLNNSGCVDSQISNQEKYHSIDISNDAIVMEFNIENEKSIVFIDSMLGVSIEKVNLSNLGIGSVNYTILIKGKEQLEDELTYWSNYKIYAVISKSNEELIN